MHRGVCICLLTHEGGSNFASEVTPARRPLSLPPCLSEPWPSPVKKAGASQLSRLDESAQVLLLSSPCPLPALSPNLSLPARQDQGSCKPNPYIKRELEKYLEQKLLTVHPCSVLALILNQEMALNSRSKHRNRGCQHRNQKQSLTGRGERDLAQGRDGG